MPLSNSFHQRWLPLKSFSLNIGRPHRPDYWTLIWTVVLLMTGLIVIYAISPALARVSGVSDSYYVIKQVIAICLSLVAFIVAYKVPLSWWRGAYKPLLLAASLATLLAFVLPVNPAYPAHRWVRLGGFSFQSVELLKFAVLIWLAGLLAQRIRQGTLTNSRLTLWPLLITMAIIGVAVVGIQSDLGSAGVMIAMMVTMAYVAGLPLGRIFAIAGIVLIGLILAISASSYRRARLETYFHPTSNCQTSGYQACQALIAVGSGGFLGLGLGASVQAYGYQPEAANDSIFAIYAEQFGFIGSLLLLMAFGALFYRLKLIAERTEDDFCRLLVIGVLTWLSAQTLINVGAMIGLLPLKGITLPFISYGGTSMVFTVAAMGLILQISRYANLSINQASAAKTASLRPNLINSSRLRKENFEA